MARASLDNLPTQIETRSFRDIASDRLTALCAATGVGADGGAGAANLLGELLEPWGESLAGARPTQRSDIGDDSFPVEFSLALDGDSAEVRVLFEARHARAGGAAAAGDMSARWVAGQELNLRLERDHGVRLDRLRQLEDLFRPTASSARWSMWHSLCLSSGAPTAFKVYLNPQAQGKERAPAVIAEALRRLGYSRAAAAVGRCPRAGDELKFFSLDLDDRHGAARVKVYKAHHAATRRTIAAELAAARDHNPGAFAAFWDGIVGSNGPFLGLPLTTYLSLVEGDDLPSTATVHFPIRDYADNDEDVFERVRRFLRASDGAASALYERAIAAFATRALDAGVGMHSYVAFRSHRGEPRLTMYLSPEVYATVPPRRRLEDRLAIDAPARAAMARDAGNLVSRLPRGVYHPTTVGELADVVRWCGRRGVRLAARGQGHSMFGQSQVADGVVVDMSGLRRVDELTDDRIVVGSGCTWRELLLATTTCGRTPPVLTAYQGLSVGGTLSVGGLSGMSWSRGAQVDHVLALDVVTGDGDVVTCSAGGAHPELFDAVLAGLGQCALIARATLALTPAPARVRQYVLAYDDPTRFLDALRALARPRADFDVQDNDVDVDRRARFDGLSGTIFLGPGSRPRYQLNAFSFFTPPDAPDTAALLAGVDATLVAAFAAAEVEECDYLDFYLQVDKALDRARADGLWDGLAHPWLDLFLPDTAATGYLSSVVAALDPREDVGPPALGPLGQLHIFPLCTRHLTRPLLRVPEGELVFLFDILTSAHAVTPAGGRPSYAARMLARNRALYERARDLGGTRYGIGAIPFAPEDWRRQLGPAYAPLARQKQRYDPAALLTPSCEMWRPNDHE